MASSTKHGLLPPVQAILNDVEHMQLGVRIPKDKFLMWLNILKRQHQGNTKVFLQLGVLGVQFARRHSAFVSDQFLIMAAVGLEPAKVGALLDPESVETRVASIFVQKFQQSQGGPAPGAAVAPPRRQQRVRAMSDDSADVTVRGEDNEGAATRVTVNPLGDDEDSESPLEPTTVYSDARRGKNEETRLERTPLPRRRSRVTRVGRKKSDS